VLVPVVMSAMALCVVHETHGTLLFYLVLM
jgi:hypothetical protein